MAVFYIIYSPALDSFYIGSCENFEQRFDQHLNGSFEKAYTKKATDWEKFLLVENLSYLQARKIEIRVKSMKSRNYLNNLKKYEEMRLKLIEKFTTGSSR